MENEPLWVDEGEAVAINALLVERFGGLAAGVRDTNLLRAALARPLNKWHYDEPKPTIFELAAAYAFALCKGHAFFDGNKRIAHAVAAVFLDINGVDHRAPREEVVATMLGLADGSIGEREAAAWFARTSR